MYSIPFKTYLPVLLAGALFPLAFAPFNQPFLAFFCLAVLFKHWRNGTPKQGFIAGGLFGLGQFTVGISWVYISIHDLGGTALFPSLLITLLFIAMMAVFPALAGYLTQKIPKKILGSTIRLLLFMPVFFVLMEWVRGWFLTGFPWLLTGYSQTDTWLAGYAPIGGVYFLSWLAAIMAALLLYAYDAMTSVPQQWPKTLSIVMLLFLFFGLGKYLHSLPWTVSKSTPITVSLVQGNIAQELKWQPEMRWPSIERYFEMTKQSASQSDLVIWPETAMPVLYREVSDLLAWFRDKDMADNAALLTGVPIVNRYDGNLYNGMILLGGNQGAEDEAPQVYYKRHLVPFGEYLPLRSLLAWAAHFFPLPGDDFSVGPRHPTPLVLGDNRLSLSICYEDAFGNEMLGAMPEANILVNVSNDAWFGESIAADQHLQMARMRAMEFGRPLLRATNTGISAFIDKKGQIVAQAPQFEQAVLSREVFPAEGVTPYMRWGNYGILSILFALLGIGAWLSARKNTVA